MTSEIPTSRQLFNTESNSKAFSKAEKIVSKFVQGVNIDDHTLIRSQVTNLPLYAIKAVRQINNMTNKEVTSGHCELIAMDVKHKQKWSGTDVTLDALPSQANKSGRLVALLNFTTEFKGRPENEVLLLEEIFHKAIVQLYETDVVTAQWFQYNEITGHGAPERYARRFGVNYCPSLKHAKVSSRDEPALKRRKVEN